MAYNDQQVMLIVAVEGGASDWAAYSLTNWLEGRKPDESWNHWLIDHSMEAFINRVREEGQKMYRPHAQILFPNWDERLVWRD